MITTSQMSGYGDMEETNSISIKKGKLLFAAFLFTITAHAQWAIQTAYVNSNIGTGGINFLVTKTANRHQFGFGLRINMYSLAHKDDQGKIYIKRLYPKKFYQNFGIAAYYQYDLLPKIKPASLFCFSDIQITHSTQRNSFTRLEYNDQNEITGIVTEADWFGPFLWIENTIGLGLQVQIFKNWSLINKFGFGIMSIIGDKWYAPENTAILVGSWYEWELTYTVQLGLSYTFGQSD